MCLNLCIHINITITSLSEAWGACQTKCEVLIPGQWAYSNVWINVIVQQYDMMANWVIMKSFWRPLAVNHWWRVSESLAHFGPYVCFLARCMHEREWCLETLAMKAYERKKDLERKILWRIEEEKGRGRKHSPLSASSDSASRSLFLQQTFHFWSSCFHISFISSASPCVTIFMPSFSTSWMLYRTSR